MFGGCPFVQFLEGERDAFIETSKQAQADMVVELEALKVETANLTAEKVWWLSSNMFCYLKDFFVLSSP